ncbi:hypothetical protein ASPWEDRAFT_115404 [Aspergillus wentii DTO 134E9]|uniref:Uncharacterized protein n=1 Tax=Aspergillus wentii DTO 134E9 TaxID=1073089 RepID=A0A1L9RE25_ASPWE|nr:uncharacterized protein ASPWEDRAFT_115404 [Aspergillus wentii DTO 134E9]OJJ33172.1 hypothetical protein ASPWEDRAFT_115404 [Aspergillus wentii DTO 134E9]
MCRQYFTMYEWCQCEEDAGQTLCTSRKQQSCPGISIETVHMQCFCHTHSTKGWKNESTMKRKDKLLKRRSDTTMNEKSTRSPRRWYHLCR